MDFSCVEWNLFELNRLVNYLETIKDEKYKIFNDKIVNTTSVTIGVQIPKLRLIAKNICKGKFINFLNLEMPDIYELHILYILILSKVKENGLVYSLLCKFLPNINNWSVCDTLCSELKIINENKEFYLKFIKEIILSRQEFIVRVGLILLLKYYISSHLSEIFEIIKMINLDKYYVNMGIAWLLSMCYVYSGEQTLNFINNSALNKFIKNKIYQKIIESRQVSNDDKNYIKSIKTALNSGK